MTALTTPRRLSLAQTPTPLEPLERLSRQIDGPMLWVKRDDLTGSTLTGNKVRKLEFSFAEAQDRGAEVVITCGGIQSNHCRATAVVGAKLGIDVHLVLRGFPDGAPDGNTFLDYLMGAEVTCYPPVFYRSRINDILRGLVEDYGRQGKRAHVIPLGASDATGMWGYITASEEMKADFTAAGFRADHIVCATGSGGTQAGLIVGNALHGLDAQVWGINVCDDEAYFVSKIRGDLIDWRQKFQAEIDVEALPIRILDGHVGPGYAQATDEIRETIARVAQTEGLVLDPVYTGKAFHGLLEEIRRGRFKRGEHVVFIHTGGIFGLLAQRETFGFRTEEVGTVD